MVLLVLPPLLAVIAHGGVGGFAPLHHLDVVGNTLLLAFASTALALLVGGGLALALAADVPGQAMLERLVVMPLYLTPLLTAIGWNWLASPRGGLLNLLLRDALHLPLTLNVVSPVGVIFVTALACVPLPYLLISEAGKNLDAALLDAGRVHGARPLYLLRRITAPLLLPAGLAAALLVMVQAIGLFSIPAVLGLPAGFAVATTEIFQLLDNYPPRIHEATDWGVLLLGISTALMFAQVALLRRQSFATVTGKSFRPIARKSGAPWLRAACGWLYVSLATILPLTALLWAASVVFVTTDRRLLHFTAQHFRSVLFGYPKTWIAAGNSMLLGGLTATAVCGLGVCIAWFALRGRSRLGPWINLLSLVPLSMPAMVFALGLLWVYVAIKLPIYGTGAILLIAYITHYLPFGTRTAAAALGQLHPELEEAARVSGGTWRFTMQRITLPLLRSTAIATWALLFILAMQEVSSSMLLYSSRSIVLSVAVFDLWENGNSGDVAALGFVQLAVGFVVVGLLLRARRQVRFA